MMVAINDILSRPDRVKHFYNIYPGNNKRFYLVQGEHNSQRDDEVVGMICEFIWDIFDKVEFRNKDSQKKSTLNKPENNIGQDSSNPNVPGDHELDVSNTSLYEIDEKAQSEVKKLIQNYQQDQQKQAVSGEIGYEYLDIKSIVKNKPCPKLSINKVSVIKEIKGDPDSMPDMEENDINENMKVEINDHYYITPKEAEEVDAKELSKMADELIKINSKNDNSNIYMNTDRSKSQDEKIVDEINKIKSSTSHIYMHTERSRSVESKFNSPNQSLNKI